MQADDALAMPTTTPRARTTAPVSCSCVAGVPAVRLQRIRLASDDCAPSREAEGRPELFPEREHAQVDLTSDAQGNPIPVRTRPAATIAINPATRPHASCTAPCTRSLALNQTLSPKFSSSFFYFCCATHHRGFSHLLACVLTGAAIRTGSCTVTSSQQTSL